MYLKVAKQADPTIVQNLMKGVKTPMIPKENYLIVLQFLKVWTEFEDKKMVTYFECPHFFNKVFTRYWQGLEDQEENKQFFGSRSTRTLVPRSASIGSMLIESTLKT